jgi:hypothetical protein
MKTEQFQLRNNNSMCAGAFQLLCGRAPAQLRGNIACKNAQYSTNNQQRHSGGYTIKLTGSILHQVSDYSISSSEFMAHLNEENLI